MGIEQKENARILVVDDADSIRLQICAYLRQHGYNVNDAWSLAGAMRAINLLELDLAIVDLELGDGDGLTLVRALQEKGVPCMVVSVRSAVIDRVLSLELGADDYMVKPIDLREMLLRVKKIVAHNVSAHQQETTVIDVGPFRLDLVNRAIVTEDRKQKSLSLTELILLRLFLENQKKIIDRTTLARRLFRWENPKSRALDMLVSKLRSKIDRPGHGTYIKSVRGVGYIFDLGNEVVSPAALAQLSAIDEDAAE